MKRLVAQFAATVALAISAASAFADDAQIAKQIIQKLRQQQQASSLQGFDIGVQVNQGTVTMMGQVADGQQATLALDIARRVQGVKLVVNDLQINQSPVAILQVSMEQVVPPQPAMASVVKGGRASALAASTGYATTGAVGSQMPVPFAAAQGVRQVNHQAPMGPVQPAHYDGGAVGGYTGEVVNGGSYGMGATASENPAMPGYAWPSYAAYPNYGAVTYPQQYSATAWPYIGPFYPYPQVPLGWRKVTMEWDDGWWYLDFQSK